VLRSRARGFSLVELLVVLFVIVLVTSLATLGFGTGSRERELDDALAALSGVFAYALDEAQYTGRDIGLRLHRDGVGAPWRSEWLERWPEGWRAPQSARDVWRAQVFPEGVEPELTLEGRAVALDSAVADGPAIVLYASGETTPGELVWREVDSGDRVGELRWDLLGRLQREDTRP
jgi:type II secretion system protein H